MKKNYTMTLDSEAVEKVQAYCKQTKQTFSGVVNGIINEFACAINGQPTPVSKPVGEMTLEEFGNALKYWMELSKEEKTEGIEKGE